MKKKITHTHTSGSHEDGNDEDDNDDVEHNDHDDSDDNFLVYCADNYLKLQLITASISPGGTA